MIYTTVTLDYLLQCLEAGISPDDARSSTLSILSQYRENMTKVSYTQTIDLIERIVKIVKRRMG